MQFCNIFVFLQLVFNTWSTAYNPAKWWHWNIGMGVHSTLSKIYISEWYFICTWLTYFRYDLWITFLFVWRFLRFFLGFLRFPKVFLVLFNFLLVSFRISWFFFSFLCFSKVFLVFFLVFFVFLRFSLFFLIFYCFP